MPRILASEVIIVVGIVLSGAGVQAQVLLQRDVPCIRVAENSRGLIEIERAEATESDGDVCALTVDIKNLTAAPIVGAFASICPVLPSPDGGQARDGGLWGGSCDLESCFGHDACKSPRAGGQTFPTWGPGQVQRFFFYGGYEMVDCDTEGTALELSMPYACFADGSSRARYKPGDEGRVHCR